MQVKNTNPPVRLTGRHITVTEAMEDYIRRRLTVLHLDYPTILEVHAILGLEKYRQRVDIVLRCNRHITIKTSAETDDMYASIDQAVDRTARQMRKYHTRRMCEGLRRRKSVRRAIVSN
ncbi:MAG: ribosome-associated translation inhibitor RaiA [Verrucomicrobia bacterium]|nr:ribosome-associated translation inhibitor RaiA [Verrucomicrobiota bacterium]